MDVTHSLKGSWETALVSFERTIPKGEFELWFEGIRYVASSEQTLTLGVPHGFYRDQMTVRYKKRLEAILKEITHIPISVEFVVQTSSFVDSIEYTHNLESSLVKQDSIAGFEGSNPYRAGVLTVPFPFLRKDYTFDNFVVGQNNSFAFNACLAIAQSPGTAYNPCLIYGGVGLGKTHLMQAIGNYLVSSAPQLKVLYLPAESFINEFIQAIIHKKTAQFKDKYRNADVLLIDDIHDLRNKKETQEELFHTFNSLYNAHKQMVFTSDRPPSELLNFTDRLKNRFERGLNVDLLVPSWETRYAILKRKLLKRPEITLSDEVLEFVARQVNSNVRDLEAALIKLLAYAKLINQDITVDLVKKLLHYLFKSTQVNTFSKEEEIQNIVCQYFSISLEELKGKSRVRHLVRPRQLAIFLIREYTNLPVHMIGGLFGGRDHTTIMYALDKVQDLRQEPLWAKTLKDLRQLIRQQF